MKRISIKYNPYLIKTEILVDGNCPKNDSALYVGKSRLQEWVDNLPHILKEEYRDCNFEIKFVGTKMDYDDLVSAFEPYKQNISTKFTFEKTADIDVVETEIDSIFKDIQSGPIAELKDKKITDAFTKAKNSMFEVAVIATMSSGKSTLINALLGRKLMPAANEATTATIVRIIDTPQENVSVKAYDKSGRVVKQFDNVEFKDMQSLNADTNITRIDVFCKIPFVSSVGMKLVLVDTPGPNNSRNEDHREMTYKMISDSDKSLVLFVVNAQQLGIDDEKNLLDYVCTVMKEGGRQTRERFMFVVNKMDAFKINEEGEDCMDRALNGVKENLESRGIENPNIFPVSALSALEWRIEDDDPSILDQFIRRTKKYKEYHLEDYYQYTHQPLIVKQDIDKQKESCSDNDQLVEIYSGIYTIEQAISQYVKKYARTTKVCDLVLSFNEKLEELATTAHLEEAIRKDKETKAIIEKQISQIRSNIKTAQDAQECSKRIDKIDLTTKLEKDIKDCIINLKDEVGRFFISNSNDVEESKIDAVSKKFDNLYKEKITQMKVQIENIIQKSYKESVENIIEEYVKSFKNLQLGINSENLKFNPYTLVNRYVVDLKNSITSDDIVTKDEGYDVQEKYQEKVKGNRGKRAAGGAASGAATGAIIGSIIPGIGTAVGAALGSLFGAAGGAVAGVATGHGEYYKTKTRTKHIDKYVDYVNMSKVAANFMTVFGKQLMKTKEDIFNYVREETDRLKDAMKEELKKINTLLDEKLKELSKTMNDKNAKESEIALKEKNLKWLEGIQSRINNIIKF